MAVKVHWAQDVVLDSVPSSWWTPITKDWFGEDVESPPEYAIGCSAAHLLFAGRRRAPPVTVREARLGERIEGLWNFDAAELFVRNGSSSQYLEINLGPQSAWWLGLFSDYRQADGSFPQARLESCKPVLTWSDIREESWSAGVVFARQDLPFMFGPPVVGGTSSTGGTVGSVTAQHPQSHELICNVTFCIAEPKRRYLTVQKLPSEQPDFHCLATLQPGQVLHGG